MKTKQRAYLVTNKHMAAYHLVHCDSPATAVEITEVDLNLELGDSAQVTLIEYEEVIEDEQQS